MDENNKIHKKNIKISLCLCFCCLLFGFLTSAFFLIFYKNNALCGYTNNKYICELNTCNNGFWGSDCIKCHECINGYCDGSGKRIGTGKCICNKGWSGVLCDTCDQGFWGSNCSKCDNCINGICNGTNTNNGNGRCICYKPYIGKNCDRCVQNFYGTNCSKYCNNKNCDKGLCNNDGTCDNCENGYIGSNCDKCDKYYNNLNDKCVSVKNLSYICNQKGYSLIDTKYGLCNECPKNKYGYVCSNNGNCDGIGTVYGNGLCKCNNNFMGDICQYNGIIINISLCNKMCNFNGVCLNNSNNIGCNCNDNFIGETCNKCQMGYIMENNSCIKCYNGSKYWGEYCSKCDCINGNCNDGIRGDGGCDCYQGWDGDNCDKCAKNHYGDNCDKCTHCGIYGICDDGFMGIGACICNRGYTGENCNQCINGFIKNKEFCDECPGSYGGTKNSCNNKGICVIKNNRPICVCNKGYSGNTCSDVIDRKCIEYNKCNKNGKCIDNECYCNLNYYGTSCNMTLTEYKMKYGNISTFLNIQYENMEVNNNIKRKGDIENNNKSLEDKTGEGIAISIVSVFGFIGCIVGTFFYVKYRPNPIKRHITNSTRSHQIELTPEEKKYMTINPIVDLKDSEHKNIMVKAITIFERAVDHDHNHDYEEALNEYKKGNDLIVQYLKYEKNAQQRFAIAKRLNVYLKREQYLQNCIMNKKLITDNDLSPYKTPILNKK